ncbi:MAG: IS3 family transposase [Candidatus Woesearchaeota archaeon]
MEKELRNQGIITSVKRVNRLMKTGGIQSKRHKKFVPTTNSNHNLLISENILYQNFTSVRPMEVLTSI